MQRASKAEDVFRPGDLVSESGVYAVVHDQHRQRHYATVLKGERFPLCARCGEAVRFMLMRPATPISEDRHFQKLSNPISGDKPQ
jgi:hypothetical protein